MADVERVKQEKRARAKRELDRLEREANAFFDARPSLEMGLYVAWRCGKLLEYWHGCDELRELAIIYDEGYSGVVEGVDRAAGMLFFLLRREWFREVVTIGNV